MSISLMPLHRKAREGEGSLMPLCQKAHQPSRFIWTIMSIVHAPKKWCSFRSYSIVTVCSDRQVQMLLQLCTRIGRHSLPQSRHPHRFKSNRPRDRGLLWRTANRSAGTPGPRPLLPGAGCAGKSVKRPGKRRYGQRGSLQAVSKLFKCMSRSRSRFFYSSHTQLYRI